MVGVAAQSAAAQRANPLVTELQQHFVSRLQTLSQSQGQLFASVEWLRNGGKYGGGVRFIANDSHTFNRASVNVSQVQYENEPDKALASATALSSIIHPHNPRASSIHLHLSWTELKRGHSYWRIMADLNPAIVNDAQTRRFKQALRRSSAVHFNQASEQGDRYFFIPALNRHRGASHFYLENYFTDNPEADIAFAEQIIRSTIDCYIDLSEESLATHPTPTDQHFQQQLAYHTLYFFQVLTMDRGTTSGLLVHDENDIGILGSLPARVNPALLASWLAAMPKPQNDLLQQLINALPITKQCDTSSPVDDATKKQLANIVRAHYSTHPEALKLQARADLIPPTVANHQSAI